jgi:hypothetical protein
VHVRSEEKTGDLKDRFDDEFEQVFHNFSKCHMKILLDFNTKVRRERFSDQQLGMRVLHQDSNE